ncbi:MAG: hypothetical protein MGG11_09975 [Trichodesmium sp. MAG_R03]|nr:hypothetical protein [Trichodesmium sp. MAG_R03]
MREWDCPEFDSHHKRDIHLSINILTARGAVLSLWSNSNTRREPIPEDGYYETESP